LSYQSVIKATPVNWSSEHVCPSSEDSKAKVKQVSKAKVFASKAKVFASKAKVLASKEKISKNQKEFHRHIPMNRTW
jgi:hypothetical protein